MCQATSLQNVHQKLEMAICLHVTDEESQDFKKKLAYAVIHYKNTVGSSKLFNIVKGVILTD